MITATDIFCLNELGKRANNEDCISPPKGTATSRDALFIVCDGVGGENKGEVASEIVSTSIRDYFKNKTSIDGKEKEAIQKAIQYANENLAVYVATDARAKRMSTTLALVLLGARSVIAAWCGDTRIHHIRNGNIVWKSKDHSLVSELVNQGELTEEEAKIHPNRNVVTRSLNTTNSNNDVDFHEIHDFETGDYLLLCTDGFLEKVDENVIYTILTDKTGKDKAKEFLSYCDGITKDNFSMYLIRGRHITGKTRIPVSRSVLIISVLLLIIIFIAFLLILLNV